MTGDLDLEQRYRRVLRLLPGYYRDKWEEDQQLSVALPGKNQALQLHRLLVSSG